MPKSDKYCICCITNVIFVINPWCTPDIQNLISLKSKYFQLLKFGFVTHEENTNFKNKVKRIIEKCKIEYYKQEFSKKKMI